MGAPIDNSGVPRERDTGPEPLRGYAVMRTVRALERLAFRSMSAPELAASVQIDPRTTRRLLARLVAEDYVSQTGDSRHRYRLTLPTYITTSDFWNRTLQNWQSEFLAVGSMVILSVYLRQRGSPESKPVGAPHAETATEG